TMLPPVILVGDELPRSIDPSPHVGEVGGAVIVPAKLIPAHELYAYGFADRLRHHRGGLRGIVIAAATECARALIVLDPDLLDRQPKHDGEHGTRIVNVLGRGADQRAVRSDIGNCAV